MRSMTICCVVFAVLLSWGCVTEVGPDGASAALTGEPDAYRCYPHDRKSSVCAGNGITFFSSDLRFHSCAKTRAGRSCWVDPESAPNLPLDFFSEAQTAVIDCPDGTWLTCTDDDAGNFFCWCEPTGSGGGSGGGGGEMVPTDQITFNFSKISLEAATVCGTSG